MDSILSNEMQVLLFNVSKVTYAVPINQVDYIEKYSEPTKIPNSPAYIEGVINLRGSVIPVLDLRKKFSTPNVANTNKTRIIIVLINNRKFGIIVDSVSEVISLNKSQLEPSLPSVSGIKSDFIMYIGKFSDRLIIVLNIEKILYSEKAETLVEKK